MVIAYLFLNISFKIYESIRQNILYDIVYRFINNRNYLFY